MTSTRSVRTGLIFTLMLSVFLLGPNANAQVTRPKDWLPQRNPRLLPEEKRSIAAALATEINLAINKRQGVIGLREKVIGRIAKCAFLYGVISKQAADLELKSSSSTAADVSLEVTLIMSKGVSFDRFKQIVDSAHDSILKMPLRSDAKETFLLMRNCKSFNSQLEIDDAVAELTF